MDIYDIVWKPLYVEWNYLSFKISTYENLNLKLRISFCYDDICENVIFAINKQELEENFTYDFHSFFYLKGNGCHTKLKIEVFDLLHSQLLKIGYSNILLFENTEKNIDSSCLICLEDFQIGQDSSFWMLSDCNHVFHRDCIKEWVNHGQNTCPKCRTQTRKLFQVRQHTFFKIPSKNSVNLQNSDSVN